MEKTWTVFALATLVAISPVYASDDICFEKAQTQAQLNDCTSQALKVADVELNTLYRQMQNRLKDNLSTKKILMDAQRKWLKFRDAECSFTSVISVGGSIHALQFNTCLIELTRSRARELRSHLTCGKDNEQETMQCALPPVRR